jgi:hypothetical protein
MTQNDWFYFFLRSIPNVKSIYQINEDQWRVYSWPKRYPYDSVCVSMTTVDGVSKHIMQQKTSHNKASFTLSKSAQEHLQDILPNWIDECSKKGLVPILSHSGVCRKEKGGKVLWEYRGPDFLLAGQRIEALGSGKYYDLLGCPVWIDDFDNHLLTRKVLTAINFGSPEAEVFLVLENAPDNYFETAMQEYFS